MPKLLLNREKFGGYSCKTPKGSLITVRKRRTGDWYWNIQSPEEVAEQGDYNYSQKIVGKDRGFDGELVSEQIPYGFGNIHSACEDLCSALGQVYGGVYSYKLNSQFTNGNKEGTK